LVAEDHMLFAITVKWRIFSDSSKCHCWIQLIPFLKKRHREEKYIFNEEGVKVFILKNRWNRFLVKNLFPARKSANCQIEKFTANSEKILLDFAVN